MVDKDITASYITNMLKDLKENMNIMREKWEILKAIEWNMYQNRL